jgi:hypothetical protein
VHVRGCFGKNEVGGLKETMDAENQVEADEIDCPRHADRV